MAQNWLHCNECFYQADKKGLKFYLTNCSHIYCERCVTDCTKDKCKLCKATCTSLPLAGKIPKRVEEMFTDPLENLKKNLNLFVQGYEFHRSHHKRLFRYLQQKGKHYDTMKRHCDTMKTEGVKAVNYAKNLEKECQKLKKENEYFKTLINKKDCASRIDSRNKSISGLYEAVQGLTPNNSSTHTPYSRYGSFNRQRQDHTNMNGYNIPPGRLLMRSPPEVETRKDAPHFNMNTTPDSGFDSDEHCTPLTVPRPIHFGLSQD